jgi:hypothetical protein
MSLRARIVVASEENANTSPLTEKLGSTSEYDAVSEEEDSGQTR